MDSDFKKWAASQGFNGKEVSKAGDAIGIGQTSARERHRGEKELSLTERLAMSAVAAGLPAWAPDTQVEVNIARKSFDFAKDIMADKATTNQR